MKSTILKMSTEEQTNVFLTKSILLQSNVAGTMPKQYFELLSENERSSHISNALEQMPAERLSELLDNHAEEL